MDRRGSTPAPTGLAVLAVAFLAGFLLEPVLLPRSAAGAAAAPDWPPPPGPLDLRHSVPRELRRLPGVGDGRARAIARARWEHPPEAGALRLVDVVGVGPRTDERVRAALGVPPDEPLLVADPPASVEPPSVSAP